MLLSQTKIEYYYQTAMGMKPKYQFPFSNRLEYINWRNEWRFKYAELSNDIREKKQFRRAAAVELKNMDECEHWNSDHAMYQSQLACLKSEARRMMEIQMAAKLYAMQLKNAVIKKIA